MSPVSMSPLLAAADPQALERAMRSPAAGSPAEAAARQFEAALVRQLVGDALKPMLGGENPTPGSDVYQYLVADVVSQQVAAGGGLGIAKMLVPHLAARAAAAETEAAS